MTRSIMARIGTSLKSAELTVLGAPVLREAKFWPESVTGGSSATLLVRLTSGADAGGAQGSVISSSPLASVPSSLTISPGTTIGTVSVGTLPVAQPSFATVTVSYAGSSKSAILIIRPPLVVSLSVPSAVSSGSLVTATLYLSGPAPTGYSVSVSSNSSVLQVPSQVTVPPGSASASFPVSVGVVTTSCVRHIFVSRFGVTKAAAVTITP